jgi:signal transduction histidine kinase
LRQRAERWVVAAGYAVCLVLQIPLYVFAPAGKLSIADEPGLAQAGLQVQRAVGACVVLAACGLLVQRIRAADAQRRRVLVALDVFAVLALLTIPVSGAMADLWGGPTLTQAAVQLTLLGLVPLAFAAAMWRGAFARTADLSELAAWLGADEARRPTPRDALAGALGDPSLELLFALPGSEGLIDEHGAPVAGLPPEDGSRGAVDVVLAGARVGAIVYDARVLDRPDEVREAGRVLALAIDRERLVATLRASRARIAAAGDEERRRIARDLHDGLQSRLVFLKIQAGMGASAAELSAGIEGAIDDLRELVDGVMPEPLTARGLPAAVTDLVDRLPAPVAVRVDGLRRAASCGRRVSGLLRRLRGARQRGQARGRRRPGRRARAHRRRPPHPDRGRWRRRGPPRRRGGARDARPHRRRRRRPERGTAAGGGDERHGDHPGRRALTGGPSVTPGHGTERRAPDATRTG